MGEEENGFNQDAGAEIMAPTTPSALGEAVTLSVVQELRPDSAEALNSEIKDTVKRAFDIAQEVVSSQYGSSHNHGQLVAAVMPYILEKLNKADQQRKSKENPGDVLKAELDAA